jgi:hypothetical protein
MASFSSFPRCRQFPAGCRQELPDRPISANADAKQTAYHIPQ